MSTKKIPILSHDEKKEYFFKARQSERKRFPKILHKKGDYNNKVINYVLQGSYMQPHLHPGEEKIEKMYLLEGSFALILFDDDGEILETNVLKKGESEFIFVPAFTWHTYIMLDREVIIYETMDGVYDPFTWKKMAPWAPPETSKLANGYYEYLKNKISL
jgi:cupin fold WbuC family metalloprotein